MINLEKMGDVHSGHGRQTILLQVRRLLLMMIAIIVIILSISSFIYNSTKQQSLVETLRQLKTCLNSNHQYQLNSFSQQQQNPDQASILVDDAFSDDLSRRSQLDSFSYNLVGSFGDGLFTHLYVGSSRKKVIFFIDTSFPYLLVNNFTSIVNSSSTESALSGLRTRNSTTFVGTDQAFNISNVDHEYASGIIASDQVFFNSKHNISLPKPVQFLLSNYSTINVKNKYVVNGEYPKVVVETQYDNATNSRVFPANIIGLGMSQSNTSFLSQLVSQGFSNSQSFSLYADEDGVPNILFGAVDPTKFEGKLAMTPILKSVQESSSSSSEPEYSLPFVLLTGVTLTNNEYDAHLNLSDTPLSIPTLLNPNTVMSYLPYELLVELASQFGAFFSKELAIWIQDCSFQSVNGTIDFLFSEKVIQVPVKNLFVPLVNSNNDRLYLATGGYACALAFYPAEIKGYSSLGSAFFQSTYLFFDYTNKYVGLAQSNGLSWSMSQNESSASNKERISVRNEKSNESSHNASSTTSGGVLVIQGDPGEVISVTTMSIASDASVVTISSPSAIPNSDQSNSLTINSNGLLSVSPTDEISTNTLGSHLPPTTQTSKSPANDNGVSVTGSSFMESSAQQLAIPSILMYFCILFSCLAMLLVFS